MILTAFDWKFNEEKDEIPPEACRPSKKLQQKTIVEKEDPKKVRQKTMGKSGFTKVEQKQCRKSGFICLYTFIYLHIPLYTLEYLYIPLYAPTYIKILNIRKMRSDIRPTNGHKWGCMGSSMARILHAP